MNKNQMKSKIVTSNQLDIHEELINILVKYSCEEYKRPIADFSLKTFKEILTWVDRFDGKEIVLDLGCGTGESSFNLAKIYPNRLVIGIDKSFSRIERKNNFKKDLPSNVMIVRGELLDLCFLFYKATIQQRLIVYKQYLFYPNPWPKKKLIKRRFHANPVFAFMMKTSKQFELRTNWKIYAEEFLIASQFYEAKDVKIEEFTPTETISNFEQKYLLSDHNLFKVQVTRS